MPSLLPGCEYDIFISYRHNDNLDGWVSDFVQNLERELKATIKEPLTIYFDKNPHDGLLETHTVGKSLEGKLRCAVFIPILSQTYCDPKSFAWRFEFNAFNNLAKLDSFGMEVRLGNGNVTSRILPIKIHTLDTDDTSMVEKELGGPLRAIEFIYTEPGVNRPLKVSDNRTDNQNKTDYHNQVNKTAQAIKEIVHSLQHPTSAQMPGISESPARQMPKVKATYIRSGALVLSIIIIAWLWPGSPPKVEKSIAVIPFVNMSPDKDNEWFSDGLTDEVLISLASFDNLKVTARTSCFYFKGKNIPLTEIAEMLGVSSLLEGTVKIVGNQMRITVKLLSADGVQMWSKSYNREKKDLLAVQVDIAENIGNALLNELSVTAKTKLAEATAGNPAAREFFMKGLYLHERYRTSIKNDDFENAEKEFLQAIRIDSKYVGAYAELANLYDTYGLHNYGSEIGRTKWKIRDTLVSFAEKLDPQSPQLLKIKWALFERSGDIDSAILALAKAYDATPNDPAILSYLGSQFGYMGMKEHSDKFFARARTLDPLSTNPYMRMADAALKSTDYDSIAWRIAVDAGLAIDPDDNTLRFMKQCQTNEFDLAKFLEMQKFREENDLPLIDLYTANIYAIQGRRKEALQLSRDPSVYYRLGDRDGLIHLLDSLQRADYFDYALWIRPWVYNFAKGDPRFKEIERLGKEKREKFAGKYGGLKWKGLD